MENNTTFTKVRVSATYRKVAGAVKSGSPFCFFFVFMFLTCLWSLGTSPLFAQSQSFEAESGILANGASVQDCNSCSGAKQVGNLGGSVNGSITLSVTVQKGGDYDLSISYATADPRTIFVTANTASPIEVPCQASGGWSTVATTTIRVNLQAGANTLKFDNRGGWAPNLDKFTVTPSPVYTISGRVIQAGAGISGVQVAVTGATTATTQTNAEGVYEFTGLVSEKNYTITPSAAGKVFFPAFTSFTKLNGNKHNQDFTAETACTTCSQTFAFGGNNQLIYNTQTGTYSLVVQDQEVISNAHAQVKNGTSTLTSMQYAQRTITQTSINDGFGSGKKITVTLVKQGLPEMQQVFYIYDGKGYFLTEVSIRGSEVSSNYMAPLVTNKVDIGQTGDTRFLFVPFDNDAWARYEAKAVQNQVTHKSSEVTVFYENNSRRGLVIGSVEHAEWKTGTQASGAAKILSELAIWGGYTETSVTRDAKAHGTLTGTTVKSPKILVGLFDDWRNGMDEYAKANAIAQPRYIFNWNKPTPFGWNSWGVIQDKLNLDKAKKVANFFADNLPTFRNDNTVYIDLDSYWDNLASGGLEGDFSALVEFVNHCQEKGLKAGIYWAPFVDWAKSNRRVEGSTYNYQDVWTKVNGSYHDFDGCRALDPTHPATQQRINLVIDKFIRCGFEMIKIDFIGHAAVEADSYFDPTVKTGMQAFRKGMEHLITKLNGKMLVYVAISPNLATGPFAHMRRIACDAYADINATEYTLNSTTYGWWQTHIYNHVDADHLVFGNQSLGENRARLTSGIINGPLITGDDFSTTGNWTERAKTLLQNQEILATARNGKAFIPVEGNVGKSASEAFVNKIGDNYYVALVNYGSEKNYDLSLNRLGIPAANYSVTELFTGRHFPLQAPALKATVGAQDATIFKLVAGTVNSVKDAVADASPITLYPNPASKLLNIKSETGIKSIRVSKINGQVITELKGLKGKNYRLNLSDYASGMYCLALEDANGKMKYFKIVKE